MVRLSFDISNVNYYDLTATQDGSEYFNSTVLFGQEVAAHAAAGGVPPDDAVSFHGLHKLRKSRRGTRAGNNWRLVMHPTCGRAPF